MKKVEVSGLIYILYEFLYDKLISDDCKLNEVLDFDYDEITRPILINDERYTEIEYRFNLPITDKCEPFSLSIIIPDDRYIVHNSDTLNYYNFYINTVSFINKIIDNIPHCFYLKEFIEKFIIGLIISKYRGINSEEEDIYNSLLGRYQVPMIEKVNNKYVFTKTIGKN